ncbi:demethylmenaquinone methyltransferase [Halothece sp. PCC 7418]|uniref:bifunctional demethylmenaquinone methyltransferase/2-methoxy-6-polyprenyl-1,4-benzoquinol methylase UbiE n=1 Tax=Halothece sp. (strain PCC 7418) TaxID=65093 RepID=UPI0002A08459|nr:bifunctional demethylmenaquinone methyltransferase/2-methoxy-6-polyprenyl-1,4-benzoquinol methylase UbiE [Halothece sp. PCC 7418]AFZ42547.1 demethylmenaquinone methyltransferase [Halothece sp. PCC 7418]
MTPSPTSTEIQGIFDRIAPVYDQLNDNLSFGQHRIWKRMAVKWANPQAGDRALDLCCGSGDLAFLLAKMVGKTGTVIGADFSSEQLEIARQRQQQQGRSVSIAWVEADALSLPFPDDQFDCATIGYGLRNVTNIADCLGELYRVLKPGATASILDFHRPYTDLMRQFQEWYLQGWVVPAAERLGLKEDYAYISPSLDRFPQGQEQEQLARSVGFTKVKHYAIALELMGVLVITKPA